MALIPKGWGPREDKPRSARWPKELAAHVERIAKATQHDFTDAHFLLLRWACEEFDAQRAREQGKAGE